MRFGIAFGLLAASPLGLLAQGTGVLAGVVKEDSTGRPIAGAEVSVDVARRQALTDAQGRFRLADVAAGAHTVNVRRLGYAPLSVTVQFAVDEVVEKTFTLRQSAASLDTLKVLDTHRPLTGRAAFYDSTSILHRAGIWRSSWTQPNCLPDHWKGFHAPQSEISTSIPSRRRCAT